MNFNQANSQRPDLGSRSILDNPELMHFVKARIENERTAESCEQPKNVIHDVSPFSRSCSELDEFYPTIVRFSFCRVVGIQRLGLSPPLGFESIRGNTVLRNEVVSDRRGSSL